MARVVVVGAGVAGLAAAVRLAHLGHDVTVLEQASTVGGGLGSFSRDGYTFDTGEPTLTLPAVYRDLFRTTGAPLERSLELVPVEPSCRFRFPDGAIVDLPNASRARTMIALDRELGPGTGRQWDTVLQHGEQFWRLIRKPLFDRPPTPGELTRLAIRVAGSPTMGATLSLRTWAQRAVPDHRLRAMLESQAGWVGADPRRTPAVLAALPYLEHAFGTWYIPGGMHRLAIALAERAALRGATIRTSSAVVEVVVGDGHVRGIRLADGETLPAQIAVVSAYAGHLYPHLVVPARRERRELARSVLLPSVFTLLLAVRGRTPNVAHRTIVLSEDAEAELDWLVAPETGPPPTPTVYISVPDDPSIRPAGGEAWAVHARAPRHGSAGPRVVDWDVTGVAESFGDGLLDVMAARGFDFRERILWRTVISPADRERATRAPGGAVGGLAATGLRSLWRRPANDSSVHGLFLVGASTHPGPGLLPFAGQSAAFVADMIGRA